MVERQLAACVNLLPGVESIYRWDGQLEHAAEVLGIFKTASSLFPALAAALAAAHPYAVPEIVALEPAAVADSYLAWVVAAAPAATSREGHGSDAPPDLSHLI